LRIADHQVIEVDVRRPYQPYDRLVLRQPKVGRWIGTVLMCEAEGEHWRVMAIRCLPSCQAHWRRR